MQGLTRRILVPAVLLACAAMEMLRGGDALPSWIANLSFKAGAGPDAVLRALIAAQLAGATLALFSSALSRPIAWMTAGALAFSGLAELSAIVGRPGTSPVPPSTWVMPLVGLGAGIAGIAVLARPAPPRPARRTGAWAVIGTLAACVAAAALAGRLELAPRSAGTIAADGVPTVVLNPEEWVGMTLPQSGLARHLPAITPLTLEGTRWIVFYNPACSRCHEVFRAYFGGPQGDAVIAVEVPPVPGEPIAPGDDLGDVECAGCPRLSLPPGTRWVITSPTIVRVEEGRVACATASDYGRCRAGTGTLP